MGAVNAKERSNTTMSKAGVTLNFDQTIRVDKVNVNGLQRTKDDLVVPIVKELFSATNFSEVLMKADKVYRRLESLECFKDINISIDTSKGPNSTKDGVEVTLNVKELKKILGSVNALTGNEEASLAVGVRMPNLLGRAEKLQTEYSYGNRQTSNFNVSFSKPLQSKGDTVFKSTIYQQNSHLIWSGYKDLDRGVALEIDFNSAPQVRHSLQWEAVWRQLSCINRKAAFEVREHSGHSLKSALIHSIIMDRRNRKVFPTSGTLFELKTEYAGLGGDVGFLKNEVKVQANVSAPLDVVFQGSFNGGVLNEFRNNKKVYICDRFFLGGPTSVRGFEMRGVGPHVDNCALGAEMYWAAGLHAFTPLPFNPFEKRFGDLFRTHFFVNAGNIGHFDGGRDYRDFFKQMITGARLACGAGLALRLGPSARVELNFCLPLSAQLGDRPLRGFQIGVGIQFL